MHSIQAFKNLNAKTMKVIISRSYGEKETQGTLYVFNGQYLLYECKTLELPWLDNKPDISCILEGIYDCQKINSPKNGFCFLVKGVPGRDSIEIHIGNFATGNKVDTKGCILPGIRFVDINNDGDLDITGSTFAMDQLLKILPDEFKLYIL